MADGRKNNGGARPGAGRPSKSDEQKMLESIKAAKAPDQVWEKLAKHIDEGKSWAFKLYLNYLYGKPNQNLNVRTAKDLLEGFQVIRDEDG